MKYLGSRDFPLHCLVYWLVLWLCISQSRLNQLQPPSNVAMAHYTMFLVALVFGYALVRWRKPLGFVVANANAAVFHGRSRRMRMTLGASAFGSAIMLLVSLHLAGAFDLSFLDYFAKVRVQSADLRTLTGIHHLDILTKILAFPLSYTVILTVLSSDIRDHKLFLAVAALNFLAFSYLWQVNYPLIHLFWILFFYVLLSRRRGAEVEWKLILGVPVLFLILVISAANRFGGDVLGGIERYVVGYHLVGFSFYDAQLSDAGSILHSPSFGRSSLGFLEQVFQVFMEFTGSGYESASAANSTFNNQAIDLGREEIREFNAFGTFLFGLYRDLGLAGIIFGGISYGVAVTSSLYRSKSSWSGGAIFLLLASSWMMGMMVNPIEQSYFWFSIIALMALRLINRGFRWGRAAGQ